MVKKKVKKTEKKAQGKDKSSGACADKFCPIHGLKKLKLRGRIFKGGVKKKFLLRVVIEFERMKKVPKYERYEKRKTRIHARLPDCMKDDVDVGDIVEVAECRPLSKMIHFVVVRKVKGKELGGKFE